MSKESLWNDFESWKEWGIKKSYYLRSSGGIEESKNKEDRSWYYRGKVKGWIMDFFFIRKFLESTFGSLKGWKEHGLNSGFNERSPTSIQRSNDRLERIWYDRGRKKKWLQFFTFNRKTQFNNFEEWKEHGIKQGFDKRIHSSLEYSKDKKEVRWYHRGSYKKWVSNFPFFSERRIHSKMRFKDFLEKNPQARDIIALAQKLPSQRLELESILMEVYEGRFENLKTLSGLVDATIGDVFTSLKDKAPTLTKYMGNLNNDGGIGGTYDVVDALDEVVDKLYELGSEIPFNNRLYNLLKLGYGPLFNQQPKATIGRLGSTMKKYKGKARELYGRVRKHYEDTLTLQEKIHSTLN